jgi:DNA polymerase-3 subunit beta
MKLSLKKSTLEAALLCAAVNDVRYYLKGAQIEILNDSGIWQVITTATDGHVLFNKIDYLTDTEPFNKVPESAVNFVIPNDAIKAAIKNADKKARFLTLEYSNNKYILENVIFTPIDGKYPDYRRVIPLTLDGNIQQFNYEYLVKGNKTLNISRGTKLENFELKHNSAGASVMQDYENLAIFCVMALIVDNAAPYTVYTIPTPQEKAA